MTNHEALIFTNSEARYKTSPFFPTLSSTRRGFIFLYADTGLSRDQFDRMYATYNAKYEEVRERFACRGAFPHVYEKISRMGRTDYIKIKK